MKISDLQEMGRRIEHGEWIDNIPMLPGMRLKVCGLRNSKYEVLEAELLSKARRLGPNVPQSRIAKITAQCLHDTVLLDWDGLTNDDGSPLPFDRDLAGTMLRDPEYQVFRDAVLFAAAKVSEMPALGVMEE